MGCTVVQVDQLFWMLLPYRLNNLDCVIVPGCYTVCCHDLLDCNKGSESSKTDNGITETHPRPHIIFFGMPDLVLAMCNVIRTKYRIAKTTSEN